MTKPRVAPWGGLGSAPLAAVVFLATLLAPTGAAAASSRQFPTLSLNDRGTDVETVQILLLDRGWALPETAVFDPATQAAVASFQLDSGLSRTGVVDPATWLKLVRSLSLGSTGAAVRALQLELHRKRGVAMPAHPGTFDGPTKAAVVAFQRHMGLTASGSVGATVWRELIWHFQVPTFSKSANLCDYSTGNGTANWATAEAIASLQGFALAAKTAKLGMLSLGDASLEHGGDIAGHETHEIGLDLDILAVRHDRRGCAGTTWRSATYDRAATLRLIKLIRALAPGHIKLIYFDDPVLIREGYTTYKVGHDDHVHVRFCEAAAADSRYVCKPAALPPLYERPISGGRLSGLVRS
ncbi:MAG TPA: peptidoglycan-binding protein [Candidatus Binatia bacterium]|nr:peptidoglycan-binding protein [Candidatus Binatia bacterium]